MKVKYRACDLCKRKLFNEGDVKFKYKAKRKWYGYPMDSGWDKIEICAECLEKIIGAVKECDT